MQKIGIISANGFPYDGIMGFKPHSHPFHQIFYTIDGYEEYQYEGEELRVDEGAFLFVLPDSEHGMPAGKPGSRVLDVKFNVQDEELSHRLQMLPPHMKCTEQMRSICSLILEESQRKSAFYSNIISSLLEALLYSALCEFCPQYGGDGVGVLKLLDLDYNSLSECVQRTLRRIEGAIVLGPDDSVLDDAAQMIGYSKRYMCRRFSEEMGVSILQYITMLRIDKAKELLLSSDHSVRDIAALLYFNDSARFCKTFKKYTGMTPTQYRRAPAHENSFLLYSYRDVRRRE